MSGLKVVVALLLAVIFESVAALECYECLSVEKCEGDDRNKLRQCDRQSTQPVAAIAAAFFPKLGESLVDSDKFQCTSLEFTSAGATKPSVMVKGCMPETKESLCRLETNIANGNFSCQSCNTNKCNSGVTVGWSFLMLMVGLVVTRMVK